jgi:hypothetical protein
VEHEIDLGPGGGQLEKLMRHEELGPERRKKAMSSVKNFTQLIESLDLPSPASAEALDALRNEFISRRQDNAIHNCHKIQQIGKYLPFMKEWRELQLATQRDAETVGLQQETETVEAQMRAYSAAHTQEESELEGQSALAKQQRQQASRCIRIHLLPRLMVALWSPHGRLMVAWRE